MSHFSFKTVIFVVITLPLIACQSINSQLHSNVALGDKGQQAFKEFKTGNVEWVTIGNLLPTQMNLGQKQNAYKLARWQKEPKKQFEELCETYGMRAKVEGFDALSANVHDLDSFQCAQPRESKEGGLIADSKGQMRAVNAITPVYIAPNGELYLTDGHHTISRFYDMPGGGADVPVLVKVIENLSHLETMNQFWEQMTQQGNAYLFDNGKEISFSELPRSLGMKSADNPQGMGNDNFRAVTYYTRDIGWDKGAAESIPFLEYQWAEKYRAKFSINETEGIETYSQLVLDISRFMVSLPDDEILGNSGKTTKQLGKLEQLGANSVQQVIEKVICEWDEKDAAAGKMKLGKLGWAFYNEGVAIKDFPEPCNQPDSYAKRYDVRK